MGELFLFSAKALSFQLFNIETPHKKTNTLPVAPEF
jgi:hypothetical protein